LSQLGSVVKLLSADQLNMVDDSSKNTVLEIAVFLKNIAEACEILTAAGADPVCQNLPRDFSKTALGKATRYEECIAVVPVLCRAVKEEDWEEVVAAYCGQRLGRL
jgi:NifB/MoaA-like Fe-S oxidoreductase